MLRTDARNERPALREPLLQKLHQHRRRPAAVPRRHLLRPRPLPVPSRALGVVYDLMQGRHLRLQLLDALHDALRAARGRAAVGASAEARSEVRECWHGSHASRPQE